MNIMRKQEIRKYRVSDANLVQKADYIMGSAHRDLVELSVFGVSAEMLAAVKETRDHFSNLPADVELAAALTLASSLKRNKARELRVAARKIAKRAQLKYGDSHIYFTMFGINNLSRQKDQLLLLTAREVVRVSGLFLPMLASEGLTTDIISEMNMLTIEFDQLIDKKIIAVNNRDQAVVERVEAGNKLYAMILNLGGKGKLCWENSHPVKFSHYVLTDVSKVKKGNKPQGFFSNL